MCKVNTSKPNAIYVNPLTDFGFKKIFGDEEVMKAFLTDLLRPVSPITKIIFLDKEMQPDNSLERGVIYDLRCKTENGGEFIVEMQNRGQTHFSDRIIYYLSRSIAPQGDKGVVETITEDGKKKNISWDFELEPVIGIFFLNFHLKGFEPRLLRTVKFKVEESGELFSDKMEAYTIELPCLNKSEEECSEDLEYWTYILNNMETFQSQLPFISKKSIFGRVGDLASLANMATPEREKYQRSLDRYRTTAATYAYERQLGIDMGREEGREEGRKEGRKEGVLATARNMKAAGIASSVISECTGLSEDEIKGL